MKKLKCKDLLKTTKMLRIEVQIYFQIILLTVQAEVFL